MATGKAGRAGAAESTAQDGRAERSRRSRERLIEALIELVEAGHLAPTGQEVADRAGMNLRTVFRHFEDMEALYAAIHERLAPSLHDELYEPPPEGSLAERRGAFVRRRMRIYERIAPFQRSEALQRWNSPQLAGLHAEFVTRMRADLRACLPEVASLEPPLRHAVEALTAFESWQRLREEQGLGPRQAAEAVRAALERLLPG